MSRVVPITRWRIPTYVVRVLGKKRARNLWWRVAITGKCPHPDEVVTPFRFYDAGEYRQGRICEMCFCEVKA